MSILLKNINNMKFSIEPAKQPKIKKSSEANDLTKSAIYLLTLKGFNVWRQNNNAVFDPKTGRFRSNSAKKGVPDIIGASPHGKFVGIEIKAGKDTVSDDQEQFMLDMDRVGAYTCVARSIEDVQEFIDYYFETEKTETKPAPFYKPVVKKRNTKK